MLRIESGLLSNSPRAQSCPPRSPTCCRQPIICLEFYAPVVYPSAKAKALKAGAQPPLHASAKASAYHSIGHHRQGLQ
jgi:hypothetical protein